MARRLARYCSPVSKPDAHADNKVSKRSYSASATATLAATLLYILPAAAHAEVVGACSGVRLPRSVVTQVIGNILVPALQPVESLLSGLTLGTVNLGTASALSNAASGAPIDLGAIDINGGSVDLLTDPGCKSQADSFGMSTPRGLSIGGNQLAGLGQNGLVASAGELDAIAIGDLAVTTVGANRAVALGAGATVSHAGSVALGAGSLANGATLNQSAYLTGGTAAAEVNVGSRRLTGVAAGAVATDAVNVAQLGVVHDAVTQLGYDVAAIDSSAVKYTDGSHSSVVLGGAGGTRISNVAVGLADDDAVTLGQLNAVKNSFNVQVSSNVALNERAVLYDGGPGDEPDTVTFAGTNGTRLTNVRAGEISEDSSDVVTGAQLHATNSQLAANTTVVNNLRAGKAGYLQVNNSSAYAEPQATGADSIALGGGAQASAENSLALGVQSRAIATNSIALGAGSIADRANSVSVGSAGAERSLTNVADGVSPTDAVNMRQLQGGMGAAASVANGYTDRKFAEISGEISSLRQDAQAGTASAMALSAIPQPIDAGRNVIGVGMSSWQGEGAVALGYSRASDNGRFMIRAGATYNSRSQGGANAGVGFAF